MFKGYKTVTDISYTFFGFPSSQICTAKPLLQNFTCLYLVLFGGNFGGKSTFCSVFVVLHKKTAVFSLFCYPGFRLTLCTKRTTLYQTASSTEYTGALEATPAEMMGVAPPSVPRPDPDNAGVGSAFDNTTIVVLSYRIASVCSAVFLFGKRRTKSLGCLLVLHFP